MSNLTSEKNKGNGGGGPIGNIGGGMDSSGRNKFIGKDDLDNSSWRQPQHHQHQSYDYMNYYNAPAASQQQFYGVPETWSNGGGGNVGPGNDQYYESFSPGPGFNFNQYYSGDYNTWGQPGPAAGPPGQRKGYDEYYSDYSTASLEKEFKDFDLHSSQSKSSASKSWASIASQPAKPTTKKKIVGGILPPPSLGWEKNGKVQAPVQAPHWVGGGSRPVQVQTAPVLQPPPPQQQQQQQQMNHVPMGQGFGPQSQSELRNGPSLHGGHHGHGHGHGQQQFHQPPPQQQQQQQQQQRYAPFNSTANSAPPLIPHDSLKQQRNREEVAPAPPQVVQQQQQAVVAATPQYPDDSKIKSEYNPTHFDLSCEEARFFVIKSYSEDDIHRSIKYEIWCSTEHGNKRLDTAFRERGGRGPIYLFFSVNSSGHFCGMAQMMSAIDYESSASVWSQDKWKGQFKVKWIYVKDVPNNALRQIKLENNENKSVTNSRDTQEVPLEKGKQVLRIIHTYHHTTSIFDDFIHYEKRQEEELRRTVPPVQQEPQRNHGGGGGGGRGGYFGDRDRDRDRGGDRDRDRGGRGRDDHHHGGSHQQRDYHQGPPMHGQGGHRGGGDRGPPSLMSRGGGSGNGRQLPPRI